MGKAARGPQPLPVANGRRVRALGPEVTRAFIDGYREVRPLRPGARRRFRLYMLLDRLWVWEYARRNQLWFPLDWTFRRFAQRAIELDTLLPDG